MNELILSWTSHRLKDALRWLACASRRHSARKSAPSVEQTLSTSWAIQALRPLRSQKSKKSEQSQNPVKRCHVDSCWTLVSLFLDLETRFWLLRDFLGPAFGRTDFSRIFIFEPPDFFADFLARFFLLIFAGKSAQKNPPGKSPRKSSKIYTTKILQHISADWPGQGFWARMLAADQHHH